MRDLPKPPGPPVRYGLLDAWSEDAGGRPSPLLPRHRPAALRVGVGHVDHGRSPATLVTRLMHAPPR